MRVCAIDVGTNTVVSVVADVADGALTVLADEERFARLGQGVDASGRLAPEAMDRVLDRLAQAQATAEHLGAERTVIAATSASRDAANVGALQDRVRRELGLDYTVISGVEEAALSFRGALALRPDLDAACVIDIGGGSTEIVAGTRAEGVASRASLDVGSVRLTERHVRAYPLSADAQEAIRADVRAAIAALDREPLAARPMMATGSVARWIADVAGSEFVALASVAAWRERIAGRTPAEVLALAPDRLAGREDVVAAFVLILEATLEATRADGYHTTAGALRHGLALQVAEAGA